MLLILSLPTPPAFGQGGESTITGVVNDSTGAVIAKAAVTLTNQETGEKRVTESNNGGFFAFTAVRPSTYTVGVNVTGFGAFTKKGIEVHASEQISVNGISLRPGDTANSIDVSAEANLVPTDSEAKGELITSRQIENLAIQGRNTVELLKIVPGAVNFGGFSGESVQTQSGTNQFAINGIRPDSISNIFDGANVQDPGCNCGAFATPNREMISEIKIQTSNFGAENLGGPVVVQSISKSGTKQFHGEGYYSIRDAALNANDASANAAGIAKPQTRFQYPGFNVGGPVIIPGTNFNKNRDKLFFFGGMEWQRQQFAGSVSRAFVPTAAMRTGDFSELAVANRLTGPFGQSGTGAVNPPCDPATGPLASYCAGAYKILPSAFDQGGKALLNLFPTPNLDPGSHNGNNFGSSAVNTDNRLQSLIRVDYNISDNTKLYARYNREIEDIGRPYGLWWAGSVPYPSNILGHTVGNSLSTSLVNIISPSLTNEVVVAVGRLVFGNTLANPKAVDPVAIGYNHKQIFPVKDGLFPNITFNDVNGGGIFQTAGGFENGSNPASKWVNSAAENVSWVKGKHLTKFGVYYSYITNDQSSPHPGNAWNQGELTLGVGGNKLSSGNSIADLLLGRLAGFQQGSPSPHAILAKNELDFYGQDSWRISSRLTVNYGLRLYHLGRMYDKNNLFPIFDSGAYQGPICSNPGIAGCGTGPGQNPYTGGTAPLSAYSGIFTNKTSGKVSRSGSQTPFAEFGPRIGFAYDFGGHGNTVLRGGFGIYYNSDHDNPVYDSESNPPTAFGYQAPGAITLNQIDGLVPAATVSSLSAILDQNNNKLPSVWQYNLTISKRLPWQMASEFSYVGNQSRNQLAAGVNINVVQQGAELAGNAAGLSLSDDAFRKYANYSTINVIRNNLSSNYNAFQATAHKQAGRLNFSAAYTFSKALGLGDGQNGADSSTFDPFDPRGRSYGPLPYDRTHQAQFSYIYQLPSLPSTSNLLAKGLLDGWLISGITVFESGAPIRTVGLSSSSGLDLSGRAIAGTPDTRVGPQLVCNPTNNLGPNQLFNASCFAAPTPGHNGTYELPYIRGPHTTSTDLSAHKEFAFTERYRAQFRFETFNTFNHPLWSNFNTSLDFGKDGKVQNAGNVGYLNGKTGHRTVQLVVKFLF
ncbi:MAG: Plug and carboxypeptidase regulatory-like domain-containing protein [Acidobacteriota bacterium]|nr:Plug and carboxypeptidase regulatory-like domain-containing protein [Acidobacteriota bacterium]